MMMETINTEIDGVKFQIHQFKARECHKIEIRTMALLSPLLNILEDFKSLDDEFDLSKLVFSLQEILQKLDDQTIDNYINRMIANTYVDLSSQDNKTTPQPLSNEDIYNAAFVGKSITLYKLLLEIMQVNKFAFFELMGGGGNLTNIVTELIKNKKS